MSKTKINYRVILIKIHTGEKELGKIKPIKFIDYGEVEADLDGEGHFSLSAEHMKEEVKMVAKDDEANSIVWVKDLEDDEIGIMGNTFFDEQIEMVKLLAVMFNKQKKVMKRFQKSYEELKKFAYEHL